MSGSGDLPGFVAVGSLSVVGVRSLEDVVVGPVGHRNIVEGRALSGHGGGVSGAAQDVVGHPADFSAGDGPVGLELVVASAVYPALGGGVVDVFGGPVGGRHISVQGSRIRLPQRNHAPPAVSKFRFGLRAFLNPWFPSKQNALRCQEGPGRHLS